MIELTPQARRKLAASHDKLADALGLNVETGSRKPRKRDGERVQMTPQLEAALIKLRNAEITLDATPVPPPHTELLEAYHAGPCQDRNDAVEELCNVLLPEALRTDHQTKRSKAR